MLQGIINISTNQTTHGVNYVGELSGDSCEQRKKKNGYQTQLQHMTMLLLPGEAHIDPHDGVITDTG